MVLVESTYPRVQFTSPRRGEVDLRSKADGGAGSTRDRNPSPQPSPIEVGCIRLRQIRMPNSGKPELGGRRSAFPLLLQHNLISSCINKSGSAQALPLHLRRRSLHRTFVVKAVMVVLDDGGDGFQRELAVGILHHVLPIEILDRDVVVAVFERAAQRFEI